MPCSAGSLYGLHIIKQTIGGPARDNDQQSAGALSVLRAILWLNVVLMDFLPLFTILFLVQWN